MTVTVTITMTVSVAVTGTYFLCHSSTCSSVGSATFGRPNGFPRT